MAALGDSRHPAGRMRATLDPAEAAIGAMSDDEFVALLNEWLVAPLTEEAQSARTGPPCFWGPPAIDGPWNF